MQRKKTSIFINFDVWWVKNLVFSLLSQKKILYPVSALELNNNIKTNEPILQKIGFPPWEDKGQPKFKMLPLKKYLSN